MKTCRVCNGEFDTAADSDGFVPSRCAPCVALAPLRICRAMLDAAKAWTLLDLSQPEWRRTHNRDYD